MRKNRSSAKRKKVLKEKTYSLKRRLLIVFGSVLGTFFLIYFGGVIYFINHFYINTEINGKDFSGKPMAAAEAYMKEQVKSYELTIMEQNNESDVIKGADISLNYKENSDIEKVLKGQDPLLWPKAFFQKSSAEFTIKVGYNAEALNEKIKLIKAVTQEQTDPVSAYPKYDGNSFVIEPEVYGTRVNMDMLNKKIAEYITGFKKELNMMEEKCYEMPQYTSESEEVQKACTEMNEYLKADITYKMDEDVIVDKDLVSTWLTCNDEMKVSLDEEKVREWVREFGKKYDTVKSTRSITTPTGKTTEVSGGTYGWSIDEEKEMKSLIESIKKGEIIEKEPAYEQSAASRSAQDWGNTYLEVDITEQHMWYIVDGAVALETDVVTGIPTPERETPTGVYSILELLRNKTLIGETNPKTGKPIYKTLVRYWMRVTWTGIGFHDADWQSSFGGTRYQTSAGSHGCINMPVDKAGTLYDMLEVGVPVIIHN